MTLLSSLGAGTSGLSAASEDLSVIGDNIANANTIGYKQSRAVFADALAQNLVGGAGQIGLGARVAAVQTIITQGALSTTGNATDLALQGAGYFEVRGTTSDGQNGTFLTRAGQFSFDKDGYLVNTDGLRVQGYTANAAGTITSTLGDLLVGTATAMPSPTGTITVKANLQADAAVPTSAWDVNDPASGSNFSTTVTIVDSLGKTTQAPMYFRKTADGTWDYHVLTDGANVQGGTAGTNVDILSGNLTFNTDGRLTGQTQTVNSYNPAGATTPQTVAFDFGSTYPGGSGIDGLTQFATTSAATFIGQDGFGAGQVTSVNIDKNGIVNGVFTNGQTRALGQVAVASVTAPEQLQRIGGNLYSTTRESGEAVAGIAGTGGRGNITSGALEQSNVDIADQFVRMISAQRNFEANSKTITTADQLLQELIAMKR